MSVTSIFGNDFLRYDAVIHPALPPPMIAIF